jgi:hypothetical protein
MQILRIFHNLNQQNKGMKISLYVKVWLTNLIEPNLINNFIWFPIVKAVCDIVVMIYIDGIDTSWVYKLKK